jgi:hypothetical protein
MDNGSWFKAPFGGAFLRSKNLFFFDATFLLVLAT